MTQCESYSGIVLATAMLGLIDNHFLSRQLKHREAIIDSDWNKVNGNSVISENFTVHGRSAISIDVLDVNAKEDEKTQAVLPQLKYSGAQQLKYSKRLQLFESSSFFS
jgi:hypothetical protein